MRKDLQEKISNAKLEWNKKIDLSVIWITDEDLENLVDELVDFEEINLSGNTTPQPAISSTVESPISAIFIEVLLCTWMIDSIKYIINIYFIFFIFSNIIFNINDLLS